MKKALVILMALTMVFGAFAEPDVTPTVTAFSGNAEWGWKTDLDAEKIGMYNSSEATLKIQFIDKEATKSTEGDGLWGELVVKAGDKVEIEVKDAAKDAWTIPAVKVDKAKIHFVDGDTYFRMNILKPGFGVGEIGFVRATDSKDEKFPAVSGGGDGYNGFTIEAGIPLADFEFAFGDNGPQASSDLKYAIKAAATVKPIADLAVYGGLSYDTAVEKAAIAANASYKLSLDDTMYVKPVVAFTSYDDVSDIGAAVLFGWGAEGQEPDFMKAYKAADDSQAETAIAAAVNVDNKCADGVSVLIAKNSEEDAISVAFNAYDSTFVTGLKAGAFYETDTEDFGKGNLGVALKYSNDFDILTFKADFAFGAILAIDEDNAAYSYAVEAGTDDVIANTYIYGRYEAQNAKAFGADALKGFVKFGAKISL